jgi:hypothetical protein
MTRTLTALLLLVAIGFTADTLAAESSPSDFAYGMSIETSAPAAAYRLTVPVEVYRNITHEDLRDLRVFNGSGQPVPYQLQQPQPQATARSESPPLPLFPLRGDARVSLEGLRVTIQSTGAALDLHTGATAAEPGAITGYVIDSRDLKPPVSGLQLHWQEAAAEFSGSMRIETSDDLGSWRTVRSDAPVLNLRASGSQLVQSRIEVPSTKASFWRLSWIGKAAPFELTSVVAESTPEPNNVPRSSVTLAGLQVPGKPGELTFDLAAKLPVSQVNLELPEANSAVRVELLSRRRATDPWRSVTQAEFYRVRNGSSDRRNPPISIALNFDRLWLAREVQPSVAIEGVKLQATWNDAEVVFLAKGDAPFLLAYGNASAQPSTTVLGSLLDGIVVSPARADRAHPLGGAERLQPPPRTVPWKLAVLWVVLGCGVMLLAWMAYRLSREVGAR